MASVKLTSPMVHDGVNIKIDSVVEMPLEQAKYLVSVEAAVMIDEEDAVEQAADPKAKAK